MGSGTEARRNQRSRKIAKAAYRLRQEGRTNNEIAQQLGIDVKVVPERVKLGERLIDADI